MAWVPSVNTTSCNTNKCSIVCQGQICSEINCIKWICVSNCWCHWFTKVTKPNIIFNIKIIGEFNLGCTRVSAKELPVSISFMFWAQSHSGLLFNWHGGGYLFKIFSNDFGKTNSTNRRYRRGVTCISRWEPFKIPWNKRLIKISPSSAWIPNITGVRGLISPKVLLISQNFQNFYIYLIIWNKMLALGYKIEWLIGQNLSVNNRRKWFSNLKDFCCVFRDPMP